MEFAAAIVGRTDDDLDALLDAHGQLFRWPDRERALDAEGYARVRVEPGRGYAVRRAGGALLFQAPDHEMLLRFPLLPALPPRCDVSVTLDQAEIDEGVSPPQRTT